MGWAAHHEHLRCAERSADEAHQNQSKTWILAYRVPEYIGIWGYNWYNISKPDIPKLFRNQISSREPFLQPVPEYMVYPHSPRFQPCLLLLWKIWSLPKNSVPQSFLVKSHIPMFYFHLKVPFSDTSVNSPILVLPSIEIEYLPSCWFGYPRVGYIISRRKSICLATHPFWIAWTPHFWVVKINVFVVVDRSV